MRATLACLLLFAPLVCQAAAGPDSLLAETAQQLLDQDFAAARETIRRAAAADGSDKTKELQASVDAVAGMPGCLVAPFRQRVGQEVRVNFPDGTEVVRIAGVGHQGDIKAERLLKARGKTVGTTPRNFNLSDLSPGERFKLLGRDQSGDRQIMRGLLAWEAEKVAAAKSFFGKANNDLGKLLIAQMAQLARDRRAANAREQKAAREAAAAEAYSSMLKISGVESMSKDTEKMITAIRRRRFSKDDVSQIRRELKRLQGDLAKTKTANDHQRILKCFGLVRVDYPLEVDQETLDEALTKLNKDNPKVVVQATFTIQADGISCKLKAGDAFTELDGLYGIPLISLTIDGCSNLQDLNPLRGMPLRELSIRGGHFHKYPKIKDLTPLKGMPLERLTLVHLSNLTNIAPLQGMPLRDLDLSATKITDVTPLRGMPLKRLVFWEVWELADISPLKGMPLEFLDVRRTAVKDMSPVKGIRGLELKQ